MKDNNIPKYQQTLTSTSVCLHYLSEIQGRLFVLQSPANPPETKEYLLSLMKQANSLDEEVKNLLKNLHLDIEEHF